jgi:hypothetical protein
MITNRIINFYGYYDESADRISTKAFSIFDRKGLKMENLLSYGADNAALSYGKHLLVFVNLLKKHINQS